LTVAVVADGVVASFASTRPWVDTPPKDALTLVSRGDIENCEEAANGPDGGNRWAIEARRSARLFGPVICGVLFVTTK
jgi:hypothetical protein